jgi:hypothetical protein
VVLIGGAGGVYAYAMNQNRRRKAAAARAAQARRAQQAQQNPNARRAGAPQQNAQNSPYAVRQPANPYTQSSSGSPYSGGSSESRNPYSHGTITGSESGSQSGYTGGFAPVSGAQGSAYERPAAAEAPSGYTAPRQEGQQPAAMGSNPFARPVSQSGQNPYARPTDSAPAAQPAQRRRAGRMERYHDAGNGTDAEA